MKKLILCAAAAAALTGMGGAFAQTTECQRGIDAAYRPDPCAPAGSNPYQGNNPYGDPGRPSPYAPYAAPYAWGLAQNGWPIGSDNYYRTPRGLRDRDGDGIRDPRDRDRDGDGVRNRRDRFPDDPRFH